MAKSEIRQKCPVISFSKMLKDKKHHMKILYYNLFCFYLIGHTKGFCPKTNVVTVFYGILNSIYRKYRSVAFSWAIRTEGLTGTDSMKKLVQKTKQLCLLNSFHYALMEWICRLEHSRNTCRQRYQVTWKGSEIVIKIPSLVEEVTILNLIVRVTKGKASPKVKR